MTDAIKEIIAKLKSYGNARNVQGMSRFGININNTLGVSMPIIRNMAKKIGTSHGLAIDLWETQIHEARILAGLVDEYQKVTEKQMRKWVREFDSWDVCDQVCMNLFDKTPFAYKKALEWSDRKEEFVKRAGFVLMACLAVHDRQAKDSDFIRFFSAIELQAHDERNFVRKAVNWALRQIGKRNRKLNKLCIQLAKKISMQDSKSAKWIAKDALRELASPKTRIRNK